MGRADDREPDPDRVRAQAPAVGRVDDRGVMTGAKPAEAELALVLARVSAESVAGESHALDARLAFVRFQRAAMADRMAVAQLGGGGRDPCRLVEGQPERRAAARREAAGTDRGEGDDRTDRFSERAGGGWGVVGIAGLRRD